MAGSALSDLVRAYDTSTLRANISALMGGTPQGKPNQYREGSPITYIAQVNAPILIIQGRHDARCPAEQIEAYEEKMKALGKEIEVFWFDGGHGTLC